MEQESPISSDRFTNWYGMDTENDETGKVTLVCLIHESGEATVWKEAGKFVEWCTKQKDSPVVICHNLEYDLVNEFREVYPYMQLNYLKGRLISAKYGKVTFWDSFNHFRMSLKALGKSLGIEKKEMDIYDEAYVTTDAWIALKAMTAARDYISSIGGRIGPTSGSSSVSVWRAMTDDAYVYGATDTEWLRRGYSGGRTEIFRQHSSKIVRGYDVNSMYPYCMLNDFPEYQVEDKKMSKEKGMAEISISVPSSLYVTPLVYRNSENRLVFPTGYFRGVWTYDEIRMAEEMGCKVDKVHMALGCDSLVRPFDEFINTLYEKRKQTAIESERLFLKVMMNSLYGKLATKSTITRVVSRHTLLTKNSKRINEVNWINKDRGLLDFKTPTPEYVNVLWGAMITAYSRMELTKYLLQVPPEKLMYCDTDSIYVEDHLMKTSNELGGLKLECEEIGMDILQKKLYRHGEKYVAKGVPKPKKDKDGKVLKDYAKEFFEQGETTFVAPIRFRQSMMMKNGQANQWIEWKKAIRTEFKEKPLSNGRYFPPVVGQQMVLPMVGMSAKSQGKKTKTTVS